MGHASSTCGPKRATRPSGARGNKMLNQLETYKLKTKEQWNGNGPSRPLVHLGHARRGYRSGMWTRKEGNQPLLYA